MLVVALHRTLRGTPQVVMVVAIIATALLPLPQVHCGHVFFPASNEVVDQDVAIEEGPIEDSPVPRVLFAQQAEDDTNLSRDDVIEEGPIGDTPEARGLWESDLFFLQKLSGLFGGDDDKPKRRRVRPPHSLRPELLPPSLSNRRNGLQHPQLHNQIVGQPTPLRPHPAAPANTFIAPYWDTQQEESNRIAIKVPPQPRPVKPTATIQNVAPAESFPYQFVRPDHSGALTNKRKPIKQQPSAPVIKRQPVLIKNKFPGNVPKPALLNGPDPSRKTVVAQSHLNNQASNSILHFGSLNPPSSIQLPPPQSASVPHTIIGQQAQTHNVRHPIGGPVLHPTPPQPFQSFQVSSSIGLGDHKQKPGIVHNIKFTKPTVPPKKTFFNSQVDPTFFNQGSLVNKPVVTKKPAMSFLDSLASMAGSVTSVLNPKPPKTQHPRPAPNPQRVFHESQATKTTNPPFNPSLQFNPSPQEGNSLISDAFQPVFVASPSLDGELDRNLMKPINVESFARGSEVDTSSSEPELVDFF